MYNIKLENDVMRHVKKRKKKEKKRKRKKKRQKKKKKKKKREKLGLLRIAGKKEYV